MAIRLQHRVWRLETPVRHKKEVWIHDGDCHGGIRAECLAIAHLVIERINSEITRVRRVDESVSIGRGNGRARHGGDGHTAQRQCAMGRQRGHLD